MFLPSSLKPSLFVKLSHSPSSSPFHAQPPYFCSYLTPFFLRHCHCLLFQSTTSGPRHLTNRDVYHTESLEGMQSALRQVPPRVPPFSMQMQQLVEWRVI
ncbi:hypothetical protein RIF29_15513 [Crotalaria pallida]|uniref:Uncharacterized protein n=1 Tax=Crotalaria pallida TaxID=3830 RepID=A0AAN9FHC6_CROPI